MRDIHQATAELFPFIVGALETISRNLSSSQNAFSLFMTGKICFDDIAIASEKWIYCEDSK